MPTIKETEAVVCSFEPSSQQASDDLKMGDHDPTEGASYTANKRPSLVENVLNAINSLLNFTSRNETKPTAQTASCSTLKEEQLKKDLMPTSSCIPIFETTVRGMGQLTVPLDYNGTVDDIAMTPAGIYFEEIPRNERIASRSGLTRKRRKQQSKTNQHSNVGHGNDGKGSGKNRKEKKRHALKRDILTDNLALSMDDCYGYDYREGAYYDAVDTAGPLSQLWLSSSFSPSSTGSIGSFQDALPDISAAVTLHLHALSDDKKPAPAGESPARETQTIVTATKPTSTALPATCCDTISDQGKKKCDIDCDHNGFVVFNDYDVFTTPSASPARRRRPHRSLCNAFRYVLQQQHSDDSQQEEDDEEEEDAEGKSGYSSGDVSEGDSEDGESLYEAGGLEDDEDDDDDCVVFCEDYDDLNDDTNSSSGYEERKVRFNLKPVVHVMRAWDFAYRQARKGDWEMAARDRERFRKRVADLEPVLGPALQSTLRDKIYTERFGGEEKNAQDLTLPMQ
uniref:PP1c_bdg domain-containing protein n=1 Tax=Anopheles dirus TaxID=7168 RepID=A0A182NV32_9DIPT